MESKRILSLEHLKTLAGNSNVLECFIQLNNGARSSKNIQYFEDGWEIDVDEEDEVFDENHYLDQPSEYAGLKAHWAVYSHIDETYVLYTNDAAFLNPDFTHFAEALEKGALYWH